MSTPAVYGGLGIKSNGLGQIGLGGPQPVQSFALPVMSATAQSYIAHLYDHNMVFKRTLGGAAIINKPGLKLTQNGGYQPIALEMAASVTGQSIYGESIFGVDVYGGASGVSLGDVIQLSEQGDNAGTILYSGNVETTPEELAVGAGTTHHQIELVPWVAELGDGYFNQNYTAATDVAQFVRDAVGQTSHCSVSPISCPNTGITAIYNFQNTNPLDAVHVARQVAGANYWWWVDAQGVVWFQPVVIDATHPATITLKRGADFNYRRTAASIAAMRNQITAIGGSNPGDPGRISAVYNGPVSQALYGVKAFNPTLSYPAITDQGTLNAIVASLGAQYDRADTTTTLKCPALGMRLTPGRPGGLTVRYFEPSVEALHEWGGRGTYSPTYVLQDIEVNGPSQTLVIGDVPYADTDSAYEAARIAQRTAVIAATAVPTPALVPQPTILPATSIVANTSTVTGIQAMGGGIVNIGTFAFTTVKAGTCQILGAVDARMESWDNQIAAPRRAVRAILSGGIFTGAWQELPFGLARATYDLSSASGIALPAGSYTLNVQIDTQGINQIHIYSGWAQVVAVI